MLHIGSIRGNKKNKGAGVTVSAVALVVLLFGAILTGCGKEQSDTESIVVSNNDIPVVSTQTQEITKYYIDGDGGAILNSSSLTHRVSVKSNDSSLGGVFLHYENADSENKEGTEFDVKNGDEVEVSYVSTGEFEGWQDNNGTIVSMDNPYRFTVTKDMELTGMFSVANAPAPMLLGGMLGATPPVGPTGSPGKYEVITKIESGQEDWGNTSGGYELDENTQTQITATPNQGYKFVRWEIEYKYEHGDGTTYKTGIIVYDNPTLIRFSQEYSDLKTAKVTCKAVFATEKYYINMASVTPDQKGVKVDVQNDPGTGVVTTTIADGSGNFSKAEVDGDENVKVLIDDSGAISNGYTYDHCSYITKDGITHTNTSMNFVIDNVREDIFLNVVLTNKKIKFNTYADPVTGGETVICDPDPSDPTKPGAGYGSSAEFPKDSNRNIILRAIAKQGYVFDCWVTSSGTKLSGRLEPGTSNGLLDIIGITQDENIKAVFVEERVTVSAEATPNNGGKISINGNNKYDKDHITINEGEDCTFEAFPEAGYTFDKWQDDKGNFYTGNPIIISNIKEDIALYALFTKGKYTIKVVASPENSGVPTVDGMEGYKEVDAGESVTLEAHPAPGSTFEKWTNQLGDSFFGETFTIDRVNNSDVYTAHYLSGDIDFVIDLTPEGAGRVQLNDKGYVTKETSYQIEGGNSVTLTAEAFNDYTFERWQDSNGNIYTTNPLQLVGVKGNEKFTAVFNKGKSGLRVVSDPASGGHVTKTFKGDGGAILEAKPNRGWIFIGWKVGPNIISKCPVCAIPDDGSDVTYVGCFVKDKNFDARTDISEMYFYNACRCYERPNYSVTRESMMAQAAAVIAGEASQYANSTPGLKEYKAYLSLRDYYAGSLDMATIKIVEGILTTTKGEVIGTSDFTNVDALMEEVKIITDKKFGERYDSQIIAAVTTTPPEGFDGLVRTYLWKNTGAEYKDNLFILYRTVDSGYEEMAAVADEDGVVRFTLEDALIGSEFALVKVVME